MAGPSAYEQLTLELINQARMDPDGEFARLILDASTKTGANEEITSSIRFFAVDLAVLKSQFDALEATAPLAWSDQLHLSAMRHSQLMIDFDTQSHNLPGELGLLERAQAAGYQPQSIGENIFLYGEDALSSHAAFFIDWGNTPTGIQTPAGHRMNIMKASFTEIGISAIAENDPSTKAGPNAITHHIGTSFTYSPKLLGVVINDTDNDDFYDLGEGVSGVTITASGAAGTFATSSLAAGGYQLDLPNGTYNVTFSGPNVSFTSTVVMSGSNVKLDAETGAVPQNLVQLFSTHADTAAGISASYDVLLGGVPSEAGFIYLVQNAVTTNYGAGPGPVFNAENIYINLANGLVQGNSVALSAFEALAVGTTLTAKIESLYKAIIPASAQTEAGLDHITRPDGLAFYQNVAAERGVAGENGAAIVAMASLLKIAVSQDIGIGNAVNDLVKAVSAGSDGLPATSTSYIDIELADGNQFDGDDAAANAAPYAMPVSSIEDDLGTVGVSGSAGDFSFV